jgi:Domain of unknown function (DUF4338)/DDE_Tnp_1-associated
VDLSKVAVRPIGHEDEEHFQQLLGRHHYLGAIPKIGQTVRYVAQYEGEWVALLSFSASSLKCAARDRWIGWDARLQYGRLKLIANNSRFLILPDWHQPNLGSKVLALCQRRLAGDWLNYFGHSLLLLETFVDPRRFHGTVYRAANWLCVGLTQGFRRTAQGYSDQPQSPKLVFVRALEPHARQRLAQPVLDPRDHTEEHPKMTLTAQQMRALPESFNAISDPRRAQGRRHPMRAVLAIAAAATLCGMRGYKAIGQWAQGLGQKGAQRIGCRRDPHTRQYLIPSVTVIRDVLMRVDPGALDRALGAWNALWAAGDRSLAIDGKTLRNATDEQGLQVHVMSAVGHESKAAYTQKKSPG